MMVTLASIKFQPDPKPVTIGPRTRAELLRRVRELENPFQSTPRERKELAKIKELLRSTGGADG